MAETTTSQGPRAVFLSYASQDAEAARRIAEALRAAGVEVWFDQSELRGGDSWDAKIRKQIKECALFVPVISANTQQRPEGYFRLEWKLAVDRSHLLADDHPFLFPVVIDDTPDATARVPDKFRDVQWTRLNVKDTPETLAARVGKLLAGSAGAAYGSGRAQQASGQEGTASAKRSSPNWLRYAWAGVGILFALIYAVRPLWQTPRTQEAKPPVVSPPVAPLSEAQKLVAQAERIYQGSDELDRETLILADDLVKRALALDSAEPSAWLLAAQLSYAMVWQSFDSSPARKADLQRQAARARALAPDSMVAQLALANSRVAVAYSNFQSASNRQDLADVEQDLLTLSAKAPNDYQVQRSLGQTYRFLKRPDEALRTMQRALELSSGDPSVAADMINLLLRRKRYAEAEALVAPALARRPIGRMLAFDVLLKILWRGDLSGAQKALAAWPAWLLREDRGAFVAWQTWLWSNEPARALDVAQRLPREYLRDVWFTGPRAVLTARAHELAGSREAALADWRTTVRLADQELAGSPEDVAALFWKAWALSRLGDLAGSEATATLLQQRMTSQTIMFNCTSPALLWTTLGRTDLAVAQLRTGFGADNDAYAVTRTMLELDPAYASLRADSRYGELRDAALAPALAATTSLSLSPSTLSALDDKSVAVLAFANLSDDKGNEYFSDGISEELLNVLAKVQGLKVTARTSSFHFKGKDTPIPEIARQLGVAYVVEGSVRKAGNHVRITAQLIKAENGFHVWSDNFDRELKDIFAVQDEIAGLIAQKLQSQLATGHARQTANPEAYQLVLQARFLTQQGNGQDWNRAVQAYQQALALDPAYAVAWGELARLYTLMARYEGMVPGDALRLARSAAQRALALEPALPIGLDALGWVQRTADWDWRGAEKSFRQALATNPSDAVYLRDTSAILATIGRSEDAVRLAREAVRLDPLNGEGHHFLALYLIHMGSYAEATAEARRAVELSPQAAEYRTHLSMVLCMDGKVTEAAKVAEEEPSEPFRLVARGLALAHGGRRAEAVRTADEFAAKYGDSLAVYTAIMHAALGDYDRAFAYLDRSLAARAPGTPWVKLNRYFYPMHQDPRWSELMHRLGLSDDQLKS